MYFGNYGYLPAQQVIQVSGKSSVDAMKMAPNSSVLVMDNTAPLVWLCISDGVGNVSATPYEIKEYKAPPAPDSVEARLGAVEETLKRMEAKLNESDDKPVDRGEDGSYSQYD